MLKMSNSRNKRTNTQAAEGTGEVVTWEWEDGGPDSRSHPCGGRDKLPGALRSGPRGGTQWRLAVGGWRGSEGVCVSRGDS